MNATTVEEQGAAILALSLLTSGHRHLPAAGFEIGAVIAPDGTAQGVKVFLHDRLDDFETWRVALGVHPATIEHMTLVSCQCLKAFSEFAGVPVELIGFGPLLDPQKAKAA